MITIENGTVIGGLGSAAADLMAEHGIGKRLVKVGLQDTYAHGASKMFLLNHYNMDAEALIRGAEDLMGQDLGIAASDLEQIRFEDYYEV